MKCSHALIFVLALSMALPSVSNAHGVRWHATQLGKTVGRTIRYGFVHPLLKIKTGLLLAPIVLPLAVGAKAAAAGTIAATSAVGAVIGAPVGAVMGAKAGALAGAAAGTAIVAAKTHLLLKALAIKKALILKPFVLAAGLKAAIATKKVALASKGLAVAGSLAHLKGRALHTGAAKLYAAHNHILGLGAVAKAKLAGALVLPALPSLPIFSKTAYKKPSYGLVHVAVNTPITGYRYKQASLVGNRRRRDTQEDVKDEVVQTNPVVAEFLNSPKAVICLARVICELSADPNVHGSEGVQFGSSLLAMSKTKHPAVSQFRSASVFGARSRDPTNCVEIFSDCDTPSKNVVRLGNTLLGRTVERTF